MGQTMVPILMPCSLLLPSTKDQRLGRFLGDKEGGVGGWSLLIEVTKNPGKN